MARKTEILAPPRAAALSSAQVTLAIRKLERRVKELQDQKIDGVSMPADFYALSESVSTRISATLVEIFGPGTIEYSRAETSAAYFQPGLSFGGTTPFSEYVQAFEEGRTRAIARLEAELAILKERAEDEVTDTDPSIAALRAYNGMDLHPDISEAASELFRNGHYANAIEDSIKALNALVRYRSKLDLDGNTLMETAFSLKKPVLKFNDLADQSDLDEQRGFMQMFAGAVAGLRNPRAHKLIKDDPERALEFIAFVSLLAKLASSAKKT